MPFADIPPPPAKEGRVSDKGGHEPGKKGVMSKLPHVLDLVRWLPLILMTVIKNYVTAVTAAFGASLLTIGLSGVLFRCDSIKCWPYVLDCIFAAVFGAMTILAWADRAHDDVYQAWHSVMSYGGITIGVAIAWIFGRPFTRDNMVDSIGDASEAAVRQPLRVFLTRVLTGMWLLLFLGMSLCALIGVVVTPPPNKAFELLFVKPGIVSLVLLVSGIIASKAVPRAVQRNSKELMAKGNMPAKMKEWAAKYPEAAAEMGAAQAGGAARGKQQGSTAV
mmetsp:Transcript_5269/g.13383  ORF Transcript_5269/g.13383 Transcript_5269/m.13383 type:complete len:277 (-) Transcript_5269:214-1044(-)